MWLLWVGDNNVWNIIVLSWDLLLSWELSRRQIVYSCSWGSVFFLGLCLVLLYCPSSRNGPNPRPLSSASCCWKNRKSGKRRSSSRVTILWGNVLFLTECCKITKESLTYNHKFGPKIQLNSWFEFWLQNSKGDISIWFSTTVEPQHVNISPFFRCQKKLWKDLID